MRKPGEKQRTQMRARWQPEKVVVLRVTFPHSPDFDPVINENELVEEIVYLLLVAQDLSSFAYLIRLIWDLNVYTGDASSWLTDIMSGIKAHLDQRNLKQAVNLLFKLKKNFGDQIVHYLSVVPPKYTLKKLEARFGVNGYNEICVCIERGRMTWDSSQEEGSNSTDAAIWNDQEQRGACYECKLDRPGERGQRQIDFLCRVYDKSQRKIQVGLVSFADHDRLKGYCLDRNVPDSVEIVGMQRLFGAPHLPIRI